MSRADLRSWLKALEARTLESTAQQKPLLPEWLMAEAQRLRDLQVGDNGGSAGAEASEQPD